MTAAITTRGAAVQEILLNDPRYIELVAQPPKPPENKKVHPPLRVVGNGAAKELTLQTAIPDFGADLNRWDWEVVSISPEKSPHEQATFRLTSPDGKLEVLKTYRLAKVDDKRDPPEGPAYELQLDLTLRNRGDEARTLNYELQGPVGLPLENVDNTSKFRDVVVGFVGEDGAVDAKVLDGKSIANDKTEEWKSPVKYIGVDVQFFAALLLPAGDQFKSSYIKSATQVVTDKADKAELQKSDVSFKLMSVDLKLPAAADGGPASEITHQYRLYAGPKRSDLLNALGAPNVIAYGTLFGIDVTWICRGMVSLLKFFYGIFHNYGIAIICLTIVVRGCLFPLSIKQARGAAKMQELQPELTALREKYGKDREKMGKAQMELFAKHKYNPLSGCLPVFMQLPIFVGLYQSLNHAVDLRMAPFLWMDNLAGPDAIFPLPFRIPLTGWTEFNLLPIITVVLFLFQQKMFMPPALNDEQAMQQKMMNFMTLFMGFLFYRVPSGLCVYFIASSLWGMAERKLLPKVTKHPPPPPAETVLTTSKSDGGGNGNGAESEGFFSKLLKAAEKDASVRRKK